MVVLCASSAAWSSCGGLLVDALQVGVARRVLRFIPRWLLSDCARSDNTCETPGCQQLFKI